MKKEREASVNGYFSYITRQQRRQTFLRKKRVDFSENSIQNRVDYCYMARK